MIKFTFGELRFIEEVQIEIKIIYFAALAAC